MSTVIDQWDFTLPIDDERRPNLEADGSFEAIAEEIRETMEVRCCHCCPWRELRDSGLNFRRVVYCVRVSRPLFDRFFNSRNGYRAAYFRSPFEGLAANNHLLQVLAPSLIASAQTARDTARSPNTVELLSPEFINESLTSLSAKVWLAEPTAICGECKGEWKSGQAAAEIINGRWVGESVNERDGRSAPYLTKIKVMGAFLDDNRPPNEFIPWRKRRRHFEIHERGWS